MQYIWVHWSLCVYASQPTSIMFRHAFQHTQMLSDHASRVSLSCWGHSLTNSITHKRLELIKITKQKKKTHAQTYKTLRLLLMAKSRNPQNRKLFWERTKSENNPWLFTVIFGSENSFPFSEGAIFGHKATVLRQRSCFGVSALSHKE